MFNENELIQNITKRHYSFKRAQLPEIFELGAGNLTKPVR